MPEDYYQILGVPRDASIPEIEEAYRSRIKETHPDVSDDRRAGSRTKQLIEARDVLTDDRTRRRYDRLGHEQFVSGESNLAEDGASDDSPEGGHPGERTSHADAAGATDATRAHAGTDSRDETTSDATGTRATAGTADSWYDSSRRNRQAPYEGANAYRTWNADGSYAARGHTEGFDLREAFASQQTIVLLGMTFMIYPVLLFGSLSQAFPLFVNLTLGLCTVLVITFLQSLPQVGVIVFGTWTLVLPVALPVLLGVSPFSLVGVLALTGVVFPLGLSTLTWAAVEGASGA